MFSKQADTLAARRRREPRRRALMADGRLGYVMPISGLPASREPGCSSSASRSTSRTAMPAIRPIFAAGVRTSPPAAAARDDQERVVRVRTWRWRDDAPVIAAVAGRRSKASTTSAAASPASNWARRSRRSLRRCVRRRVGSGCRWACSAAWPGTHDRLGIALAGEDRALACGARGAARPAARQDFSALMTLASDYAYAARSVRAQRLAVSAANWSSYATIATSPGVEGVDESPWS